MKERVQPIHDPLADIRMSDRTETESSAVGPHKVQTDHSETTLWNLIDPDLAALAMASLYGAEARRHTERMAEACEEAGRHRDGEFWRTTLHALVRAFPDEGLLWYAGRQAGDGHILQ